MALKKSEKRMLIILGGVVIVAGIFKLIESGPDEYIQL